MAYTELYSHIMHGHYAEALACIRQRKDINTACGTFENTPLHISAEKGFTDIVERLLQEDINTNAQNKFDETPLHLSVMMGHHEITELLLKGKADSNIRNCYGETPFDQKIILESTSSEP